MPYSAEYEGILDITSNKSRYQKKSAFYLQLDRQLYITFVSLAFARSGKAARLRATRPRAHTGKFSTVIPFHGA
jgi:hypothetical protein